jgi:hypothetical protein
MYDKFINNYNYIKMKTLNLILVFILFSSVTIFAQRERDRDRDRDDDRQETLFGSRGLKISGFGGPFVEFSSVNGQFTVSNGGGGAALFNQTFFLGGYGVGMSNRINVGVGNTNQRIDFEHGGFWLGYVSSPKRLVHFTGSLRLGWGGVNLRNNSFGSNMDLRLTNCFVATPEIGFEVNITRFFRIAATAGYRAVSGIGTVNLNDNLGNSTMLDSGDFNSPMGMLTFKFGWFGR